MKHSLLYILLLLTLLGSAACNNDIFIDGPELPWESNVTVEGDGGSASFRFSTKSLESIELQVSSDPKGRSVYLDAKGDTLPDGKDISRIAKIVYDNGCDRMEVILQKGNLKFISIENPTAIKQAVLEFLYSYGNKFIYVDLTPGRPMEFIEPWSDCELDIISSERFKTFSQTFNNDSPEEKIVDLYPFWNAHAVTSTHPTDFYDWANETEVSMIVPAYENGEWTVSLLANTLPYTTASFSRPDIFNPVPLTVAPNSSITAIVTVFYSKASLTGTLLYRVPLSERIFPVCYSASTSYPISYTIDVQEN